MVLDWLSNKQENLDTSSVSGEYVRYGSCIYGLIKRIIDKYKW